MAVEQRIDELPLDNLTGQELWNFVQNIPQAGLLPTHPLRKKVMHVILGRISKSDLLNDDERRKFQPTCNIGMNDFPGTFCLEMGLRTRQAKLASLRDTITRAAQFDCIRKASVEGGYAVIIVDVQKFLTEGLVSKGAAPQLDTIIEGMAADVARSVGKDPTDAS